MDMSADPQVGLSAMGFDFFYVGIPVLPLALEEGAFLGLRDDECHHSTAST